MSYVGPGSHEVLKSFGADVHHKMHFGKPYEFKANKNPAPGSYNNSNLNLVRAKNKSVSMFNRSEKGDRLGKSSFLNTPLKDNPAGGNYQHFTGQSFVSKTNKITLQGKFKERPNANPGIGEYNVS